MINQSETLDHITLGQASHLVPGRPSTNCMWRWCRKGVLSRGGERIRLQHVRIGGRIFTKPDWVEDFGRRLTEADVTYFDAREAASKELARRDPRFDPPKRHKRLRSPRSSTLVDQTAIDRELEEEGL